MLAVELNQRDDRGNDMVIREAISMGDVDKLQTVDWQSPKSLMSGAKQDAFGIGVKFDNPDGSLKSPNQVRMDTFKHSSTFLGLSPNGEVSVFVVPAQKKWRKEENNRNANLKTVFELERVRDQALSELSLGAIMNAAHRGLITDERARKLAADILGSDKETDLIDAWIKLDQRREKSRWPEPIKSNLVDKVAKDKKKLFPVGLSVRAGMLAVASVDKRVPNGARIISGLMVGFTISQLILTACAPISSIPEISTVVGAESTAKPIEKPKPTAIKEPIPTPTNVVEINEKTFAGGGQFSQETKQTPAYQVANRQAKTLKVDRLDTKEITEEGAKAIVIPNEDGSKAIAALLVVIGSPELPKNSIITYPIDKNNFATYIEVKPEWGGVSLSYSFDHNRWEQRDVSGKIIAYHVFWVDGEGYHSGEDWVRGPFGELPPGVDSFTFNDELGVWEAIHIEGHTLAWVGEGMKWIEKPEVSGDVGGKMVWNFKDSIWEMIDENGEMVELWVNGAWKGLTPEVPAEVMAGYPDVRIEEGDDGVSYLMVGEDGSEEEEMIGFSDPNQKDGWATIDEITRNQVPEWGEMPFKIEEHDGNYYGMSESNMTMSGEEAMSVYNPKTGEWGKYIKNVFQENLIVMGDYVEEYPDHVVEVITSMAMNKGVDKSRLASREKRIDIGVDGEHLDFGYLGEEGDMPKWVDFSVYVVDTKVEIDDNGDPDGVWIFTNIPGEIKDQGVVFYYRPHDKVEQHGVYLFDEDSVFSGGEYSDMKKEMVHISPTRDEVFQFFANSENIIGQQIVVTTQVNNKPDHSYEEYNDETKEWIDGMKIGDWWSGREVGLIFSGAYLPENAWMNK